MAPFLEVTVNTKPLSVKRQKDRLEMAGIIKDIALETGTQVRLRDDDPCQGGRSIRLDLKAPGGLEVSIVLDGESRRGDTHVLSWHMALDSPERLDSSFGGVNPFHRCKATHTANGFDSLRELLLDCLQKCKTGAAYQAIRMPAVA